MAKRLVYFLLFLSFSATAQHYKWVTGGGSTDIMTPSRNEESVKHMCTDAHKNLYLTSLVGGDNVRADTFYRATTANPTVNNFILASYTCTGKVRWAKIFNAYWDAETYGLQYDGGANIYCAGLLQNRNKHIGDDTVINIVDQGQFVAKFDTSGKLKWIQFVGPNTPSTLAHTGGINDATLAIDGQEYIHLFTFVSNNVQLTPTVLSIAGTYDLKYDSTGNLLSATRMPINDSLDGLSKVYYNKKTGVAYAMYFHYYLAAYSPNDTLLWADTAQSGNPEDMAYDGNRYMYVVLGGKPCIFGRDTISTTNNSNIIRVDTNGHPELVCGFTSNYQSTLSAITLLPNGNIAAAGLLIGSVVYGSDSITGGPQHSFLFIIDSNKHLLKLDPFTSNGFYDWALVATSDSVGNVYIGGQIEDSIAVGNLPAYHTNGGNTDFFVVSYGYNCNCSLTTEPTPNYNYSGSGSVNFTYTGTTTPDSVRWNFGDGGTSTSINPTHNFHDTGLHHVCLTVYACDSGSYCGYIHTTISVPIFSAQTNISVYPNPISGAFFIEGAEMGTVVRLFNVMGQLVYEGTIKENKQQINTGDLRLGTYLLQLIDKQGQRESLTLVKQ